MKFKKIKDIYFVRIDRGEFIIEQLKQFLEKEKITLGFLSGLGSVDQVELAHYIVENKKYTSKKFNEPLEIVNMTGNITIMDKKPYLHCHCTVSDQSMKAYAGHLVEGRVGATCEVVIRTSKGTISRKRNEKIGLNLFDF